MAAFRRGQRDELSVSQSQFVATVHALNVSVLIYCMIHVVTGQWPPAEWTENHAHFLFFLLIFTSIRSVDQLH